jgi:hypothetical protein
LREPRSYQVVNEKEKEKKSQKEGNGVTSKQSCEVTRKYENQVPSRRKPRD